MEIPMPDAVSILFLLVKLRLAGTSEFSLDAPLLQTVSRGRRGLLPGSEYVCLRGGKAVCAAEQPGPSRTYGDRRRLVQRRPMATLKSSTAGGL